MSRLHAALALLASPAGALGVLAFVLFCALVVFGLARWATPTTHRGIVAAHGDEVRWNGDVLHVPPGSTVRADPPRLEVVVDPDVRRVRRMTLTSWSGVDGPVYDEVAVLAPDDAGRAGRAGWRIAVVGSGSGGEEQEACGRVTRAEIDMAFCCSDQDEVAPDPTWCLPWLASLRRERLGR